MAKLTSRRFGLPMFYNVIFIGVFDTNWRTRSYEKSQNFKGTHNRVITMLTSQGLGEMTFTCQIYN